MYMYVCMYVYVVCMYVCMYVRMYVRTYVCMYSAFQEGCNYAICNPLEKKEPVAGWLQACNQPVQACHRPVAGWFRHTGW